MYLVTHRGVHHLLRPLDHTQSGAMRGARESSAPAVPTRRGRLLKTGLARPVSVSDGRLCLACGSCRQGLMAMLIIPFSAAVASVTVVLPYAPAVALPPVAPPSPPPTPRRGVVGSLGEAAQVGVGPGREVGRTVGVRQARWRRQLPRGCSPPSSSRQGWSPLVLAVASTPPAVTSHGFPEVVAPRIAMMRPNW